ncbi:hypothetical protein G5714_002998 [Onychostoma macrolepis]|uniref:Ras-related protein Rab-26 n=1 Tax=Onychostoma macrolepis TaxID=369639 RepID=A0A7J6D879_9TELE|nr:hypothetical protein G5714_002998 [Onychostoma macrolepis]
MELMMENTSELEPVEQGEPAYPDSAYGSSPVDTDTEDGHTLKSHQTSSQERMRLNLRHVLTAVTGGVLDFIKTQGNIPLARRLAGCDNHGNQSWMTPTSSRSPQRCGALPCATGHDAFKRGKCETEIEIGGVFISTILVGDSGVGKTSLLVQFDQGKFIPGSFSATVGIGFTVSLSAEGHRSFLLR